MTTITSKEFKANQSKILSKVLMGEKVVLKTRMGSFSINPVIEDEEDYDEEEENISLTERICRGLREVKLIQEGKIKPKSLEEIMKEL